MEAEFCHCEQFQAALDQRPAPRNQTHFQERIVLARQTVWAATANKLKIESGKLQAKFGKSKVEMGKWKAQIGKLKV